LLALLYKSVVYASFLKVTVKGAAEKLPFPALYVANHQSAADIMLLGSLQGTHPHFWFYWDQFSHTPIFNIFTTRLGLGITQDNPRHDARTVVRGITYLQESCNGILFPEGGRFTDGKIHEFQCGFALLARKAHVPVVPVYIHNINKAYPPRSILIYAYPVTLVIGAPLTLNEDETDAEFCQRVHTWFEKTAHV
jgi:1-acyl-sn-glycerol-3-phosphate acyltransferase